MNAKVNQHVVDIIHRNYPAILRRCAEKMPRQRGGLTIYDVVHETVLRIMSDPRVEQINSDKEFVDYFIYRTNAVIFKEIHGDKLKHRTHAYYCKETIQESTIDE